MVNMFRRGKLNFLNTKDDRIKIINERINLTEKHLIELCSSFSTCTRKLAKSRDSYDELSKCLRNYSEDEEINESFSEGFKKFSNAITILADYKDINVHRMEIKIVNELAQFHNLCKTTRDNLRTAVIARDKEVLKQRQILELKTKFSANNSAADSELLKAKMEVSRTNNEIDEIMHNFEKRKLNDIKTILVDFILISMKYHTKSLEALSASYYDVSNIDERGDFVEFQKLMKSKTEVQDKKTHKRTASLRSQSMESLDRNQLLSPLKRNDRISKSTKNLTETKTDEEDDEEEDEDQDEDDDEEEDEATEDSDNSKSEGDSITETEDGGAASGLENASDLKANKLNLMKPLAKPPRRHPFKAVVATHVLKKSSKQGVNAFAARHLSGTNSTGIPRLVHNKQEDNKSTSVSRRSMNIRRAGLDSANSNRRQVTVVESKKNSSLNANETENVIDCTRSLRN